MTPNMLNAVIAEMENINDLEAGKEVKKPQKVLSGKAAAVAATRMFPKRKV